MDYWKVMMRFALLCNPFLIEYLRQRNLHAAGDLVSCTCLSRFSSDAIMPAQEVWFEEGCFIVKWLKE